MYSPITSYMLLFFFFACLIYRPTFIIVDSYWRIYKFGLEAFQYLVLIQSKLTADQNHAMRAMEKSRQDFITVMFSQIISKHLLFFSLKKNIILPKPLFYHQVELQFPYIRVAKPIHLSTVNQRNTGFAYRVVSPRQSRNESIFYRIRREQKSDHETSCKCALIAHCFHKKQLCLRTLIMEKI